MAEEDAGDCDETKPSSYPGNLSYGGTVRSIYSGRNQFPIRNRQRLRMGSGAGREDSQSGAKQEAACGITHILAPVLDISRDSRMGRQGETYGEDPALAAALGAAYTKGIQTTEAGGRRPESVAKHFLGFHNSQGGIHGTNSDTPSRLMEEIYGKPFQSAISESELKGVMPCYNSIDGEPASVSHRLLTELLREKMGFDGLCVSDYGGINNAHEVQRIGETIGETGLLAMEAGMDIEMPKATGYGEELKEMFRSGQADTELLDGPFCGCWKPSSAWVCLSIRSPWMVSPVKRFLKRKRGRSYLSGQQESPWYS